MKKKIVAIALAATTALSLMACSPKKDDANASTEPSAAVEESTKPADNAATTPTDDAAATQPAADAATTPTEQASAPVAEAETPTDAGTPSAAAK